MDTPTSASKPAIGLARRMELLDRTRVVTDVTPAALTRALRSLGTSA